MSKRQRFILISITIALLCSMFTISAFAVDLNETESNNTDSTADVTYNDYNNYGKISSSSDVDWWQVTFSQNGSANFWIGNLPSGCRYGLYLYELNSSNLIAKSVTGTVDQLINARVYAGVTYKIKITSISGYSSTSTYTFRTKNYTATRQAKIYTFTDEVKNINLSENYPNISSHLAYMDYNPIHRFGYTATSAFSDIPNSSLVAIYNHAEPGRIRFANATYLYGGSYIYDKNNAALGLYETEALSNVKLISFVGCHSGDMFYDWGNLVDTARYKGAHCSIGWTDSPYHDDVLRWNSKFYDTLSYGYTVAYAIEEARLHMAESSLEYSSITAIYTGTSSPDSLTLY